MTPGLLPGLTAVFTWLLQASWQASVLVALVLLLQLVFRRHLNPRWHHALWLLVILRLVLPVLPESALSLFQFTPAPPPAVSQSFTAPIFNTVSAAPITSTQNLSSTLPIASAQPQPISLCTLLALIWLAGSISFLIVTGYVNHRFAQHVKSTPPIDDPRLLEIAAAAQAELGLHRKLRRKLRLIESSKVHGPAIMGLLYPTLILPENVRAKFTDEELRFIFLHELAHLKRGDLLLQALVALLQIFHWFNPVLWYAFRRMRADREPATDALVLSRAGEADKEPYGHVLLKLLTHYHQRHSIPTLVGILEDKDQFKRRFLLIGQFTRGAYGWSLLGVLLIAALAVLGLTARKSEAADTAKTKPPPIYVWYTKIGLGFFGPVLTEGSISDNSRVPGTNHSLSVYCKSFTPDEVTLVFMQTWPNGPATTRSDGTISILVGQKRTEKTVPAGKVSSFRIFDSIDVTTSPTLQPESAPIDSFTPLTRAIYAGDMSGAKARLDKGEVITAADMQTALEVGPPPMARLLWDNGAHTCSEMVYAISQNEPVSELEKLLAAGIPVEHPGDLTITALGMAARTGNLEVAHWLLGHGADIQAVRNPLDLAVHGESVGMVNFLLKQNARISPFTLETTMGYGNLSQPGLIEKRMEMIKLLLKAGALDRTQYQAGLLIQACETRNAALLKLYLDAGVSPLSLRGDGKTALEIIREAYAKLDAAPSGKDLKPLLDMLEAAASTTPPAKPLPGTPSTADLQYQLIDAARKGDAATLRKMLDQGVVYDGTKNPNSPTLLFFAGSPEVAELLIEHGVDVNARNDSGQNALPTLCYSYLHGAETGRVLLKHGADPNAADNYGMTALMAAGDGASVEVLIEYGAKLDAKTKDGKSGWSAMNLRSDASYYDALVKHGLAFDPAKDGPDLLARAAINSQIRLVRWLLDHGVDPNQKGDSRDERDPGDQMLPLSAALADWASPSDHPDDVCQLLMEHGAKGSEGDVLDLAASQNQKLIQLFHQYHALPVSDLTYALLEKKTPAEVQALAAKESSSTATDTFTKALYLAASLGDLPSVELLVQKGADFQARPSPDPSQPQLSISPLSLAAMAGHDNVVAYLLQHGVKAQFYDIAYAMRPGQSDDSPHREPYENTVRLLIAAGALKNITEDQTVLLLSSCLGSMTPEKDLGIIKLLLAAGLNPSARTSDPRYKGKTAIDLAQMEVDGQIKYHLQGNTKPILELLQKTQAARQANGSNH